MTLEDFAQSVELDSDPPEELSGELKALWLAKKGRWHDSHDIAQDIPSKTGSWIHALLHTIEGDLGNAGYWYAKAGEPPIRTEEIEAEWERLVTAVLSKS
ncbi:MAG: hypothetical protein P1V20_17425 [Verrucomicrobiales bacterium]|nr:hypothetical protein [Verrucomicrobiales bacterium]